MTLNQSSDAKAAAGPEAAVVIAAGGAAVPAGPLAQAIRGGASVGAQRGPPPLPQAAKAEPAAEGLICIATSKSAEDAVRKQLKTLLSSPNLDARAKALKIALHMAIPEMAGDVAKAGLVDSVLKESTTRFLPSSPSYQKKKDARLKAGGTEKTRLSEEEEAKLSTEVFGEVLAGIIEQSQSLVAALYQKDAQATVESLLEVYASEGKVLGTNQWRGFEELDRVAFSCKVIERAIVNNRVQKDPCLLKLANARLEKGDLAGSAELIGRIGLPDGIEMLSLIIGRVHTDLEENTQLGTIILSSFAAIGTPECLPNMGELTVNPYLHATMAEVVAKILNIDLA